MSVARLDDRVAVSVTKRDPAIDLTVDVRADGAYDAQDRRRPRGC
jgi:hypothetical protein